MLTLNFSLSAMVRKTRMSAFCTTTTKTLFCRNAVLTKTAKALLWSVSETNAFRRLASVNLQIHVLWIWNAWLERVSTWITYYMWCFAATDFHCMKLYLVGPEMRRIWRLPRGKLQMPLAEGCLLFQLVPIKPWLSWWLELCIRQVLRPSVWSLKKLSRKSHMCPQQVCRYGM